jgi:alkylated DNA repair dioxygenase AlkB
MRTIDTDQGDLFGDAAPALPSGWRFEHDFIDLAHEAELLQLIATLPLKPAQYKGYTAGRRVVSYGGRYDFDANRLLPAETMPAALQPLRARVGAWLGIAPAAFGHLMVAQYPAGTPLGWHRDVPDFERVVGLSLGSPARMRLRPYPPIEPKPTEGIAVELPPRSIYLLEGEVRWGWQHSIAPTPGLRHSITLRTLRLPERVER